MVTLFAFPSKIESWDGRVPDPTHQRRHRNKLFRQYDWVSMENFWSRDMLATKKNMRRFKNPENVTKSWYRLATKAPRKGFSDDLVTFYGFLNLRTIFFRRQHLAGPKNFHRNPIILSEKLFSMPPLMGRVREPAVPALDF